MTPEGQVLIMVGALPFDDELCSNALAYTESLEDMNLDFFANCLGSTNTPAVRDSAKLKELLVDCVWNSAEESSKSEVDSLLDSAISATPGLAIDRVIIFCARGSLSTEQGNNSLISIGNDLSNRGIEPTYFLIEDRPLSTLGRSKKNRGFGVHSVKRWFVSSRDSLQSINTDDTIYQNFLGTCLSRQWQVVSK